MSFFGPWNDKNYKGPMIETPTKAGHQKERVLWGQECPISVTAKSYDDFHKIMINSNLRRIQHVIPISWIIIVKIIAHSKFPNHNSHTHKKIFMSHFAGRNKGHSLTNQENDPQHALVRLSQNWPVSVVTVGGDSHGKTFHDTNMV